MNQKERNRALSYCPCKRVHAKNVPPLPMHMPESWLPKVKELRKDHVYGIIMIIAVLVMGICLLIGEANAEGQSTPMYVVVSQSSWLNGRYEPDAGSSVEARFQRGDQVDVYEVQNGWARVAGGECQYVWCSAEYLSSTPPGTKAETCTVVSDGRVRVRKTPGGELVRWVKSGSTVTVQYRIDGWAYIGDGYLMEKYLEVGVGGE